MSAQPALSHWGWPDGAIEGPEPHAHTTQTPLAPEPPDKILTAC
jgi:hypothetical protein